MIWTKLLANKGAQKPKTDHSGMNGQRLTST